MKLPNHILDCLLHAAAIGVHAEIGRA